MVWILQLLYPRRHCIIAIAVECEESELGGHRQSFARSWEQAASLGALQPWCGICGSRILNFEAGRTRFATLAQADEALKILQDANEKTRRALDQAGLTFEAVRKRGLN